MSDTEARDSLSNERTFLAWLRTGFGVAALGLLLARFTKDGGGNDAFTKVLSLAFVVMGSLCILAGTYRYAHVQTLLQYKLFPTTGPFILIITIFGSILSIATFIYVLI